jgi:hypothetical protein
MPIPGVACYIAENATDDFTDLKENETVTVVARVDGRKSALGAYEGYYIVLEDGRRAK